MNFTIGQRVCFVLSETIYQGTVTSLTNSEKFPIEVKTDTGWCADFKKDCSLINGVQSSLFPIEYLPKLEEIVSTYLKDIKELYEESQQPDYKVGDFIFQETEFAEACGNVYRITAIKDNFLWYRRLGSSTTLSCILSEVKDEYEYIGDINALDDRFSYNTYALSA